MSDRRILALTVLIGLGASPIWADVLIKESAQTTANGKTTVSQVVYAVRGSMLRAHQVRADGTVAGRTRLYDAGGGRLLLMDAAKREAEVYDAATAAASVEKKLRANTITADLKPTGGLRTLLGVPCEEYAFVIKAPLDDKIVLSRSGTAWIATQGNGVAEYVAFFRSADTVLTAGSVHVPSNALPLDRTETELYRRLAGLGGIPYAIDMKVEVEGSGFAAGLLRRTLAATRQVTTTSVSTAPLANDLFAVPAGWKTRNK